MADDLVSHVRDWLSNSGFPLEMRVASKLEKAGFAVSQGVYYVDPETSATRETDIVAYKENVTNDAWIRIFAVVECKAGRSAPWVLFQRRGAPMSVKARLFSLGAATSTLTYLNKISGRLDVQALGALASTRSPAYGMIQASSRGRPEDLNSREKKDNAYAARMSVAKAASQLLNELSKDHLDDDSFEIVWPIIVTDAPLFEASLSADEELRIESVQRSTFVWRNPALGNVLSIEVVNSDAMSEFIAELNKAIDLILYNTSRELSAAVQRRRRLKAQSQKGVNPTA